MLGFVAGTRRLPSHLRRRADTSGIRFSQWTRSAATRLENQLCQNQLCHWFPLLFQVLAFAECRRFARVRFVGRRLILVQGLSVEEIAAVLSAFVGCEREKCESPSPTPGVQEARILVRRGFAVVWLCWWPVVQECFTACA